MDLCVHPDVVNRHKQVCSLPSAAAAASHVLHLFSLCCSRLTPPASNLPQTALMLAAMHGKTDCVRRLLDAGANVSLSDTVSVSQAIKSVHGVGLLKWCFRFGYADRDVRFLARADVPALRGVLRARGLPPDHPLGGQVRAGLGILVGLRRPGDTTFSPLLFIWAPC